MKLLEYTVRSTLRRSAAERPWQPRLTWWERQRARLRAWLRG